MASKADSSNAIKWITGDAFRGAANATMPVADNTAGGLFGTAPTNGVTAMLAFGGIKAGFSRDRSQDNTPETIWNSDDDYYLHKGKKSDVIAFEAVDIKTKATVLTMLLGGSIAEVGTDTDVYEWTEGDDEEFSILLQLRAADNVSKNSLWIPRCTLDNLPTETMDGAELARVPFRLKPLAPADGGKAVRRYSNYNPLAA
jgi:hypothetical protein